MSTFGALSVVKACLAASVPEVLRETFGLRNAATDGAVGLRRDLRMGGKATAGQVKERRELGVAAAVACMGKQVCVLSEGVGRGTLRGGRGMGKGLFVLVWEGGYRMDVALGFLLRCVIVLLLFCAYRFQICVSISLILANGDA